MSTSRLHPVRTFFGQRAGFTYARAGSPLTNIDYGIVGIIDSEKTPGSIDFSVIRMITIVNKDTSLLTLRVDLFPDISADGLVRIRPSYTDLKKNYTSTKMIQIRLMFDSGQPLALVGKAAEEKAPVKVIALLKDIPIGQEIEIDGARRLWWAIGSVTEDLAYPHRMIYKK